MALTVQFWGFGKKENSTIRPNTTPLAEYVLVELKDNCSIVNPALKINAPISHNVQTYNYCYIQQFNRYYYVTDWIWELGLWVCELQVDVLASFRLEIGLQNLYILRASYDTQGRAVFDGNIVDSTYPATAQANSYSNYSIANPFAGLYSDNSGTYIVGIVNKYACGVQYYAFNFIGFRMFCGALFNYSSGWLDIDVSEISEDLQKALVNPFQYVVSAFYIPVPVTWFTSNNIGTVTNTVSFGWWSVTISTACRTIDPGILYSFTTTLTIPKHPDADSRGSYLNLAPNSIYTLRYYPFGSIDIDSNAICNWNTLDLYTDVDICTGKAILTIAVNGKNNPLRTIETTIAVPIPTASVNVDYMNLGTKSTAIMAGASAISNLVSGEGKWYENLYQKGKNFIANLRAGNTEAISSGIKNTVTNIVSSAMASKATAEIVGQQGTFTLFDTQTLTLSGRFLHIAPEDFGHRGRPLCQVRQLNTLRGFIICADADVVITCTDREKSAIQAYLEGGFYYEE